MMAHCQSHKSAYAQALLSTRFDALAFRRFAKGRLVSLF